MPRTKAEVDQELDKARESIAEIDKSASDLQGQIKALRDEVKLRDESNQVSLNRLEGVHERLRQDQARTAESLAELKAKLDLLLKLFFILLAAVLASTFAIWNSSILGWMKR